MNDQAMVMVERRLLVRLLEFASGHAIEYGHRLGLEENDNYGYPELELLLREVDSGERSTFLVSDWPGDLDAEF